MLNIAVEINKPSAREEMARCALALFGINGYKHTTIAEIARLALSCSALLPPLLFERRARCRNLAPKLRTVQDSLRIKRKIVRNRFLAELRQRKRKAGNSQLSRLGPRRPIFYSGVDC